MGNMELSKLLWNINILHICCDFIYLQYTADTHKILNNESSMIGAHLINVQFH